MKKDSKSLNNSTPFYARWWLWTIIGGLLIVTWAFLLIPDIDLRTSIIGICGVWGSTIATIFIGIIASIQNEKISFASLKESTIANIREEERRFLNDFDKVGLSGRYIDFALEVLSLKTISDPVKEVKNVVCFGKITNDLLCFIQILYTYEFCPLCIKEMKELCEEMHKLIVNKLNIANKEVSQDNIVTEVVDFIMDWDKKMQELRIRFIIQFQLLINLMTKCKNMPELQKRINTVKEKTKKIREELALLGYFDKPKKEDTK